MTKYTSFIIIDDIVNDINPSTKKVVVPHHNENMLCDDEFLEAYHVQERCWGGMSMNKSCDPMQGGGSIRKSRSKPSSGLNTVSSSLKNANRDLSSAREMICGDPSITVSPFRINSEKKSWFESITEIFKSSSSTTPKLELNIVNFMKNKLTDGSFEFSESHYPEIKADATKLGVDHKMYFNVVVLVLLTDSNESKYKLILKNLEKWINTNYKETISLDDLKSHVRKALLEKIN